MTKAGPFATIVFAASTIAVPQWQAGKLPPVCGPNDSSFDVKLEKSAGPSAPGDPGKARVYFIRDSDANSQPMMLGIDGKWVGAVRANSYFSITINPGERHICTALPYYREQKFAVLAHLQAEAGKTYYYLTRYLEFGPIDSDEGAYLVGSYSLSVPRPRK